MSGESSFSGVSWRASKEERAYFIVSLIIVGLLMLAWQCIDSRPPRWDESTYLRISLHSYESLRAGHPIEALSLKNVSDTKTGGVPFLSAISYFALGNSPRVATFLVNFCSASLLLWALLRCGHFFWRQEGLGLIAWAAFISNHLVITWMGYYQVDLPMTAEAVAVFAICLGLRSSQDRPWWILPFLAILIAVGMATKHLFVAFVAGSLLCLFFEHWIFRRDTFVARFRNNGKIWAWIIAGVICGTLYHVLNWHIVAEQLARSRDVARTGATAPAQPIFPIIKSLIPTDFLPWSVALAFGVAGLATIVIRRSTPAIYLFATVAFGILGVAKAASFPISYYFLPCLPLFYFASASGLAEIVARTKSSGFPALRLVGTGAVIVLSALYFAKATENRLGTARPDKLLWNLPSALAEGRNPSRNPFVAKDYWSGAYVDGNSAMLPYPQDWHVEELYDVVAQQLQRRHHPSAYTLASLTNYEWLSSDYFYFVLLKKRLQSSLGFVAPLPSALSIQEMLKSYDFIFLKTGKIWKEDFYSLPWATESQKKVDELTAENFSMMKSSGFRRLKTFALPDGSAGSIWASVDRVLDRSLLAEFSEAQIEADPGLVSTSAFEINGERREVLFAHPPAAPRATQVRWQNLEIPDQAVLNFGIAMAPVQWSPEKGDGVEFEVEVSDGTESATVFKKSIDPKNRPDDRRWHDYSINLNKWRGRKVSLTFITRGLQNNAYDHAGWSGLILSQP